MTDLRPSAMELALTDDTSLALLVSTTDDARGAIVCLPDVMGSKEDFAAVLPWLSRAGYTAVAVDLRGQYQSSSHDGDFSLETLAFDVAAVAEAFTVEEDSDAHVVGLGFGGLVGIEAIRTMEGPWTSLTLIDSGTAGVGHSPYLSELAAMLDNDVPLDDVYTRYRELRPATCSAEREAFNRRRFLAVTPEALRAMIAACLQTPDRLRELANTDIDVLLLTSGREQAWPGADYQHIAHELGAQVRRVPESGADVGARNPEELARIIARQCACLN